MKFKRDKIDSLSGNTVVTFTEDPPEYESFPFKIVASAKGIYFQGQSSVVHSDAQLEDLAKTIQLARTEAKKLKPKLYTGG